MIPIKIRTKEIHLSAKTPGLFLAIKELLLATAGPLDMVACFVIKLIPRTQNYALASFLASN